MCELLPQNLNKLLSSNPHPPVDEKGPQPIFFVVGGEGKEGGGRGSGIDNRDEVWLSCQGFLFAPWLMLDAHSFQLVTFNVSCIIAARLRAGRDFNLSADGDWRKSLTASVYSAFQNKTKLQAINTREQEVVELILWGYFGNSPGSPKERAHTIHDILRHVLVLVVMKGRRRDKPDISPTITTTTTTTAATTTVELGRGTTYDSAVWMQQEDGTGQEKRRKSHWLSHNHQRQQQVRTTTKEVGTNDCIC